MIEEKMIERYRVGLQKTADKFFWYEPDPDTPVYYGRNCDPHIDKKNDEDDLDLI